MMPLCRHIVVAVRVTTGAGVAVAATRPPGAGSTAVPPGPPQGRRYGQTTRWFLMASS